MSNENATAAQAPAPQPPRPWWMYLLDVVVQVATAFVAQQTEHTAAMQKNHEEVLARLDGIKEQKNG